MIFEGQVSPCSGRIAVVAARFNSLIVDQLYHGVIDTLRRYQVAEETIDTFKVPGSFEIPVVAKKLASSGKYLALIALGAVIRGETDHYDHVCSAAINGCHSTALETGIPIVLGILTCDNLEQALNRAGGKHGNKGAEAALTALEMIHLLRHIN